MSQLKLSRGKGSEHFQTRFFPCNVIGVMLKIYQNPISHTGGKLHLSPFLPLKSIFFHATPAIVVMLKCSRIPFYLM